MINRARIFAGFVGFLAGAVCCYIHLHFTRVAKPLSGLAVLVTIIAGAVALLTPVAMMAPSRVWRRELDRAVRIFQWLKQPSPESVGRSRNSLAGGLMIAIGATAFVLAEIQFVPLHKSPGINDPAAFLRYAERVRQQGGPIQLLVSLYQGRFDEANQHPFYIGLLSLCPTFEQGKWLSVSVGGLGLLVFSVAIGRRFGWLVGGWTAVLLGTNFAYLYASSLVTCESALTLFITLAWLALTPRSGDRQHESQPRLTLRRCAMAGIWLGLAYLTKGTAPMLVGGTVLWLLLFWPSGESSAESVLRPDRERRLSQMFAGRATAIGLLLAGFLLAASPLIVRNLRLYHSPFYNVNSYLLFVDKFEDPKQLARDHSLPELARSYVDQHNAVLIVERQIRGTVWETFIMLRMLGPTPLDDSRVLVGLPLAVLILIGGLTRPRTRPVLVLIWLVLCWMFFAWYVPIAASERFVVPLLPAVLCLAACGWVRLLSAVALKRNHATIFHCLLAVLWSATWLGASMLDVQLPTRFP